MFASVAGHVRAAAVLLDAHLALGTILGVDEQVVARLRVVLALDVPLAYDLTRVGRMVGHEAREAVLCATLGAQYAPRRRLALRPHDPIAAL